MENVAVTYNYYDDRGRRLAVFCRFVSPTEAEIFTLTCSRDDHFEKRIARAAYSQYIHTGKPLGCKPAIELVPIIPEERELQTLLRFCRTHYYFYVNIEINSVLPVLVNNTELEQIPVAN